MSVRMAHHKVSKWSFFWIFQHHVSISFHSVLFYWVDVNQYWVKWDDSVSGSRGRAAALMWLFFSISMVWKCSDVGKVFRLWRKLPAERFVLFMLYFCHQPVSVLLVFSGAISVSLTVCSLIFLLFFLLSLGVVLCLSCTPVVGNPPWKHQKLSQMSKNQKGKSCCECLINNLSGFEVQLFKIKQNLPLFCACVISVTPVLVLLRGQGGHWLPASL